MPAVTPTRVIATTIDNRQRVVFDFIVINFLIIQGLSYGLLNRAKRTISSYIEIAFEK
jgi:hypothetical protein